MEGITEAKALTTGEVVGAITEGANTEVEAMGGINKGTQWKPSPKQSHWQQCEPSVQER